ncbi:MAG: ribosome biogenesis GTPase YlqF [Oscillospiraceae bacterium]
MLDNTKQIDVPSIQWFPGHMAKTRRLISENIKLVDLVLEITDARIPMSSRNPELDVWISSKPRIIMLNKADNADSNMTKKWLSYYKSKGIPAIACDCKSGNGTAQFMPLLREVLAELLDRREQKGMAGRMTRIMVVGIPNVGKSSFINRMATTKKTKVEDRPGVTVRKQWVSLTKDIELLDMPGVLWPKFEDKLVGERLAFTGAVKDDVLDIELLAARLVAYLAESYADRLIARYKIEIDNSLSGYELLEAIGRKRGMLISGGEVNLERAAIMLVDEYRSGKLGKITFEAPPTE